MPMGTGRAAADGLDYAGGDHPFQVGGKSDQDGADGEDDQGGLVDQGIAVDVGQAADEGHGDGVAQQVGGDYPGDAVKLGNRDFEVEHHGRQGGDHHRLVQGGNEGAQADHGQHQG